MNAAGFLNVQDGFIEPWKKIIYWIMGTDEIKEGV